MKSAFAPLARFIDPHLDLRLIADFIWRHPFLFWMIPVWVGVWIGWTPLDSAPHLLGQGILLAAASMMICSLELTQRRPQRLAAILPLSRRRLINTLFFQYVLLVPLLDFLLLALAWLILPRPLIIEYGVLDLGFMLLAVACYNGAVFLMLLNVADSAHASAFRQGVACGAWGLNIGAALWFVMLSERLVVSPWMASIVALFGFFTCLAYAQTPHLIGSAMRRHRTDLNQPRRLPKRRLNWNPSPEQTALLTGGFFPLAMLLMMLAPAALSGGGIDSVMPRNFFYFPAVFSAITILARWVSSMRALRILPYSNRALALFLIRQSALGLLACTLTFGVATQAMGLTAPPWSQLTFHGLIIFAATMFSLSVWIAIGMRDWSLAVLYIIMIAGGSAAMRIPATPLMWIACATLALLCIPWLGSLLRARTAIYRYKFLR